MVPQADLAVSPDGKRMAYVACDDTDQRRAILVDVATGKRTAIDDTLDIRRIRFTPDGRFLTYAAVPRTGSVPDLRIHVRSVDGGVDKVIPLYSSFRIDPVDGNGAPAVARLLERLVEGFGVRVSPDGKTAVAYGFEAADDTREGRLVVSPLDGPGETVLSRSLSGAISASADVTFSPSSDRVLILTMMSDRAQTVGDPRWQKSYEVVLGAAPRVSRPAWVLGGGGSATSFIVPGSFDGARVLRWDSAPDAPRRGMGNLVSAAIDGTSVARSQDAGLLVPRAWYSRDSDMRNPDNRVARYATSTPDAPVLFAGYPASGSPKMTMVARARDGSSPGVVLSTELEPSPRSTLQFSLASHASGVMLYPSRNNGFGVFDPATTSVRHVFDAPPGFLSWPRLVSDDGKKALVVLEVAEGPEPRTRRWMMVDLATGASTELAPPADRALTPFGTLPPAAATDVCGYDKVADEAIASGDRVVAIVTHDRARSSCTRPYAMPELWRFSANGTLENARSLDGFVPIPERGAFVDGPRLLTIAGDERVLLTQCGMARDRCEIRAIRTAP